MSPSQYHAKKEIISSTTTNSINGLLPPPLKINKDSHLIKKSSSSSSSTSSLLVNSMVASNKVQQRHPVIIYTHSPKVIHTHPKDFMALVQKLTGLSPSEDDGQCKKTSSQQKQEPNNDISMTLGDKESDRKKRVMIRNEDSDSSVVTEENNCSSNIGENQVNSCFMGAEPVLLETPMNPYVTNLPVLPSSSMEFMCSSQPLLNYSDSLFFSSNMRTSISSSATLEGMKEFRDY